MPFFRPDLLYFYALDTPMAFNLVAETSLLVRSYISVITGSKDSGFYEAAVPTTATFLVHLLSQARIEDEAIKRMRASGSSVSALAFQYLGGKESVREIMRLPGSLESEFTSWCGRSLVPSQVRSKEETDKYLLDLIGVLGGYVERRHARS
jgi:hypothetical protein